MLVHYMHDCGVVFSYFDFTIKVKTNSIYLLTFVYQGAQIQSSWFKFTSNGQSILVIRSSLILLNCIG
jgi:hypothetical protein